MSDNDDDDDAVEVDAKLAELAGLFRQKLSGFINEPLADDVMERLKTDTFEAVESLVGSYGTVELVGETPDSISVRFTPPPTLEFVFVVEANGTVSPPDVQ